jgi:hypothetical protein
VGLNPIVEDVFKGGVGAGVMAVIRGTVVAPVSSAISNRAQQGTAMIVSTKRPFKETEYRIQELELTKDGGLRLETLSTQYAHPIVITLGSGEVDQIKTILHRAEKDGA